MDEYCKNIICPFESPEECINCQGNFWEKAYGELNIKEALEETFKEMDKEETDERRN